MTSSFDVNRFPPRYVFPYSAKQIEIVEVAILIMITSYDVAIADDGALTFSVLTKRYKFLNFSKLLNKCTHRKSVSRKLYRTRVRVNNVKRQRRHFVSAMPTVVETEYSLSYGPGTRR